MKIQIKKSFLAHVATWSFAAVTLLLMGAAYAYVQPPGAGGTQGLENVVQSATKSMGYISVGIVSFCVIAGITLIAVGLAHLSKHFAQAQSGQSSVAKPITEIVVGSALLFVVYLVYVVGSGLTGASGSQSDIQYIQGSGITQGNAL